MTHPQSIAIHAHAQRTVEAEQLRTRRLITHPAFCTGVVSGVQTIASIQASGGRQPSGTVIIAVFKIIFGDEISGDAFGLVCDSQT